LKSALQKHQAYLKNQFSLSDEVPNYLKKIEQLKSLNAFVKVFDKSVIEQAKLIDQKRANGEKLGALAGTIIAVKDNICMVNQPVTCASKILEGYVSPYSATVIQKILAQDGIIIGQTNLDEFAMGSSTEKSIYGPCKNPHNPEYVAGGSSGGSAVVVATGMADLALGSDTGGSVRQPAAFCGVVGIKPTYGRISRYGLVAYASSLDQIGTFGRSVEDATMLLQVIAGHDPNDSTSAQKATENYLELLNSPETVKMRIGIPKQFYQEGLSVEIKAKMDSLLTVLLKAGHTVQEVDLRLTDYAIATYYIIATAEASSNLSRYDGVRYGYRSKNAEDLESMYVNTRTEGFGIEVKRRIMLGTYVLSSGYYDAYYKKGTQVRRLIKEEYDEVFKKVDVLLTPTTPTPAFKLGEKLSDPLQMYLSDIYTVTANLTGICAMNVPIGTSDNGLPIGAQVLSNAFEEKKMLAIAKQIEELRNEL
jgi:aspartyl-tRNA(Asn)/glutamyl-tRNA(Gln) amidotransferase subunit A